MKQLVQLHHSYVIPICMLYLLSLSVLSLFCVCVYKAKALSCISMIWSHELVWLTSYTPRIAVTLLLHFVIVITNKINAAAVKNKLSFPSKIRYTGNAKLK
jgi:hypothetical protein